MKKCTPSSLQNDPDLLEAPAYPRDLPIIPTVRRFLDRAECGPGKDLTQIRFGAALGLPRATVHDWCHCPVVDPVAAFVCALERLTQDERTALLAEICRVCPRLERIVHDQKTLGAIRGILAQPTGLTFLLGPSAERTSVLTAMGHEVTCAGGACGIDIHTPNRFVPVLEVFYLKGPRSPAEIASIAERVWPLLSGAKAQFLLLNGIWNRAPSLHSRLLESAQKRHVIVAEEHAPPLRLRNKPRDRVTEISVTNDGQNGRLRISIEAL